MMLNRPILWPVFAKKIKIDGLLVKKKKICADIIYLLYIYIYSLVTNTEVA